MATRCGQIIKRKQGPFRLLVYLTLMRFRKPAN
jgi:hypothetical protein